MNGSRGLHYLFAGWRKHAVARIDRAVDELADELAGQLPDFLVTPTREQRDRLNETARQGLRAHAERLVSDCLDFLEGADSDAGETRRIATPAPLVAALDQLPDFRLSLASPVCG